MYRVGIAAALLGLGAAGTMGLRHAAWPLRATITDPHGHSVAFRALTLGGELIVFSQAAVPRSLASGDTLSATTPAAFPLDLRHGPVLFFARYDDSLRVVVGRNPFGAVNTVSAQGRRVTVRLVRDSIVLDPR